MDYNSNRKRLPLPEYGRNIQEMVDHAVTIEDREERTKAAHTILSVMGNMYPHLRDVPDFRHKLWDHIAIMSEFKLDIEYPCEIVSMNKLKEKPEKMPYNNSRIVYRHYGRTIEKMIEVACTYEEGKEKNMLIELIINHMKKSFLIWNKDSVNDDKIIEDIEFLSKGKITISEEIKLSHTKDILLKTRKKNNSKTNSKPHQRYKRNDDNNKKYNNQRKKY